MLKKIFCCMSVILTVHTFVSAQSMKIPDPAWFENCSVNELNALLKNSSFDVNMRYEVYENGFSGETPLMHAVKNPDEKITEILLDAGADVKMTTNGIFSYPATVFAVQNENLKVLQLLNVAGADMKYMFSSLADNNRGSTLLHFAAENPNPEIFRFLIKKGADPFIKSDMGGNTVLLDCARLNTNPEVIDVLLKAGLKINSTNDFNETPLMRAAAENKNPEVVKFLIDKGGDLSSIGGVSEEKSILEFAESNPALEGTEVMEVIRKKFTDNTFFTIRYFLKLYSETSLLGISSDGKAAYLQHSAGTVEPVGGSRVKLQIVSMKNKKVIDWFLLMEPGVIDAEPDDYTAQNAVKQLNAAHIIPQSVRKISMPLKINGANYTLSVKDPLSITLLKNGKTYQSQKLPGDRSDAYDINAVWLTNDNHYLIVEYHRDGGSERAEISGYEWYYDIVIFNLQGK
ncbi:MAG: ankyrin repeat domain-containing protein [Spirochaetes bacterium]|nr:ankyrin repeat domain-containing protein [Spirochaetota bacterium]